MSRIFVSHSSADNFAARALGDWLKEEGWDDVFLDIDRERGIAPGERWERRLNEAANRCEVVILLVSGNWLASEWCLKEFRLARQLNKRLIGVLIEDRPVEDLPLELRDNWQFCNLVQGSDHQMFRSVLPDGRERHVTFSRHGLAVLKEGLNRAGLDPRFFVWPPAHDPDRSPYPGLSPLHADDAGIFYGREAPTIEAMDMLRGLRDLSTPRIVAIIGASGAGKSSFLQAGLLPRLERDDRGFQPLRLVRPQNEAVWGDNGLLAALTAAFARVGLPATRHELRQAIEAGGATLRNWVDRLAQAAAPAVLVLPIDQAEELFSAEGGTEAGLLLNRLRELVEDPLLPLIVLLTIRSDAYERLQTAAELDGIGLKTFNLSPMPRGAYQTVIEGPAARYVAGGKKLTIDPRLTAALLEELDAGGGKDALPLLAFTLERLFVEYAGDGGLTLAKYRSFGGVGGAIDIAVERALKAADTDPAVPRDRQARLDLLRRGMIPWLAGIDLATKAARRKTALWSDVPAEARPLISHLVDQHLLSSAANDAGDRTIEPSHESLLRQWGLLRGWLDEDFAILSTLAGVQDAARDWQANAEDAAYLVHSESRLTNAERINERPDLAQNLTPAERNYIARCRAAEDARRDRELTEAHKLADAQTLAAQQQAIAATRQKRIATLQRYALLGASLFVVLAVALTALAWQQAGEADLQRAAAKASATKAQENEALAKASAKRAEASEALAKESAALAEGERDKAKANAYRAYTAAAQLASTYWKPIDATKLALAAWPRHAGGKDVRLEAALKYIGEATRTAARTMMIHDKEVVGAQLSPDTRRILSWSDDGTVRLWDTATGLQVGPAMKQGAAVTGASFDRDGARILSWSDGGPMRLWDTTTGQQIGSPMEHGTGANGASLSADGTRIVSWGDDGMARLWDPATGLQVGPALDHEGDPVQGARLNYTRDRILTWSYIGPMRLWDAATGLEVGAAIDHGTSLWGADFDTKGTHIVSWDGDGRVRLWESATGQQIGPDIDVGPGGGASFGPNDARTLTWSQNGQIRLWDGTTGQQIGPTMEHSVEGETLLTGARFSANGARIVSWADDFTVRTWDAATAAQIGPTIEDSSVAVGAILSTDGSKVVTWSEIGTLHLWDAATGLATGPTLDHADDLIGGAILALDDSLVLSWSDDRTLRTWDAIAGLQIGPSLTHDASVDGATYSTDGERILSWSGNIARLWDAATGAEIGLDMAMGPPADDDPYGSNGAVFGADDTRILSWSFDGTVRLWDSYTGKPVGTSIPHDIAVRGATVSPDGGNILAWSEEGAVQRWDRNTGQQIGPSIQLGEAVSDAVFSADGGRVLTWSDTGTMHLFDSATNRQIGPAMKHGDTAAGVSLSADGAHILSWSDDGTLRLWDSASGRQVGPSMMHDEAVSGASFSADGARIMSWSYDTTVRLWDVATGLQIGPSMSHDDSVFGAAFSPDGAHILSWSADGTMRLWDAATGLQVGPAMERDGPVNGAVFSVDGTRILSWTEDNTVRLWDVATHQQIGPAMADGQLANGASFSPDGSRILTWSSDGTVRQWDASWPKGTIVQIACARLANTDLADIEGRYGLKIDEPICTPEQLAVPVDWSSIERMPVQ